MYGFKIALRGVEKKETSVQSIKKLPAFTSWHVKLIFF